MRRWLAATGAVVLAALTCFTPDAAFATTHDLISGSGSSWAANAINQWIADVQPNGLKVVFTSNGSAQGRKDFANLQADYAVSDIGYLGYDSVTQTTDSSQGRKYAYLPIVAGGTAFPYQIRSGGKLVRNLRLSGDTLAKIFTNKITNWSDPQITRDNNGRQLPALQIIPVVHSEGSGSSYQFTRYLSHAHGDVYSAGATEYFPRTGGQVAENGSDGVMNFISSGAANGAIGYDEYSYALGKNYPVAKILNTAGYFTLPNQYNVAVALTKAKVNYDTDPSHCQSLGYNTTPCYLLQNLDNVYSYNDNRVYPLSSYSYMIIPIASDDPKMTTAKRQTLADYLTYSICQGQKEMGQIGYSPLPINLVQAGFQQVNDLHTADSNVDVSSSNVSKCDNPTFIAGKPSENYLAKVAPQPPACDKVGAGPCIGNGNTGQSNPGAGGTVKQTGNGGGGSTPTTGGGSTPTTGGGSTPTTTGGGGPAPIGLPTTTTQSIDPTTGQPIVAGNGNTQAAASGDIQGVAATVPELQSATMTGLLGALCGLLLLGIVIVPPLVLRRKGGAK